MVLLVISIGLSLCLLYEGWVELNLYSEQTHIFHFAPLAEKGHLCVYCFLHHIPRQFLVIDVYGAPIKECVIRYCIMFQEQIALIRECNAI